MNIEPLSLRFTDEAREQLQQSGAWLLTISAEAAARFSERLEEELATLRQSLAEEIATSESGRMALPADEEASLFFSRPVYRHLFLTGKRRQRRSSAGRWYIFFAVTDDNGDGLPDTLRVYSIRHSAAAPLSVETE